MIDYRALEKLTAAKTRYGRSRHEERFMRDIRAMGLPEPEREYRWAAELVGSTEELGPGLRGRLASEGLKDWRFDFAWPTWRLALEVEGMHSDSRGWGGGRHLSPGGFAADCEKYGEAQLRGWTIYRVPGDWVQAKSLKAINLLIRALKYHRRRDE